MKKGVGLPSLPTCTIPEPVDGDDGDPPPGAYRSGDFSCDGGDMTVLLQNARTFLLLFKLNS